MTIVNVLIRKTSAFGKNVLGITRALYCSPHVENRQGLLAFRVLG